jgi:hypothetical protein
VTLTRARLLHPHTGDPIAPLGFRRDGRPILPILGAGPDDDIDNEIDEEGDEEGDEDEDEDDEDEDDEGGKPAVKEDGKPLTQKDYDALQLALRNSRKAERRARRSERDGGRRDDRKPKDEKPKGKEGEDEDAPDVERIRLEAENTAAGTWKPLLVRREARDLLKEAGLIGKPDPLLRLIDLEDVEVDPETGEIDGLDEQIDDLRKEYKHLFRRRGTRRINGADKDGRESRNGGKKVTATEIQAMQLLGDR